ncbi:MAG: HAD family hydrolase [Parvibaculaceae bacterium]
MTALVIFDLDGVLIDSEIVASRTIARELEPHGIVIAPDEVIARYSGHQTPDIVARIAETRTIAFPDDFAQTLDTIILSDLVASVKPVAGIKDVLNSLDRASWCVASNSGSERIRRCLKAAGLVPPYSPRLFSAERVAKGKPAPDVYLHAAREVGAAPPDCLVVEDTVTGVTAGKAAGMTVIGFLGGSHCRAADGTRLRKAGADLIAADSVTLGKLIGLFRDRRQMTARLPFP